MTDLQLSTGQTLEDLAGLAKIANLMDAYTNFTPPALQHPNYIPPVNSKGLVAMAFLTMFISISMVAFRIVMTQRTRKTRLPYIEDCMIIVGLIIVLGLCIFSLVGVYHHQWGYHTYDLHLDNLVYNYKMWYIWFTMNIWAGFFIRASLIFTIRRLYSPLKTTMIRVCDVALVLKFVIMMTGTFMMTFLCGNHMEIVDIWKYKKSCNPFVLTLCVCVISIGMDLVIITLPMPLVRMLVSITKRKKIEVLVIFSFGFLAIAASIIRVCEVSRYLHSVDRNWTAATLAITSLLELCLTIATSCIPSARVLFTRIYAADSLLTLKTYFTPATQNFWAERPTVPLPRAKLHKIHKKPGVPTEKKKKTPREKKPKVAGEKKEKKERRYRTKKSRKFSAQSGMTGLNDIAEVDYSENAETMKSDFSTFTFENGNIGEGSKVKYAHLDEKPVQQTVVTVAKPSAIIPNPPPTAVLREHHPSNPFYEARYNSRESGESGRKPSLAELKELQEKFSPVRHSTRNSQFSSLRTETPETFLASDSESEAESDAISSVNSVGTAQSEDEDSGGEFEGYDVDVEGYPYDGERVDSGLGGVIRIPEPSDSFFPWATALSPRPVKRKSRLSLGLLS